MQNDEASEQELVVEPLAGINNSFDSAFEEIVRTHWFRFCGKAFKHLRNEERARDTVQDALEKAYKTLKPRPFETITNLIGYIYQTLSTCIIDSAKADALDNKKIIYISMLTNMAEEQQDPLEIEAPPGDQPEHIVDLIESDKRAMQHLEQLPSTLREAAFLAFIMDYTRQEIADKLGIRLEAAKARVTRSRKLLLNMLNTLEEI